MRRPAHALGADAAAEAPAAAASPAAAGVPAGVVVPAIEVQTVVGPLLLHRDDAVMTCVLVDRGVWEPFETRFLSETLCEGQTFVDVGANIGYFSVLAARRTGASGSVIAVEPERRNVELLRANLRRNGADGAVVVPLAAHSESGLMSLALDERNRGDHRLAPAGEADVPVRCVRLDDVLPDVLDKSGVVDVVKVDAQGFDHDVVAGLQRTIEANPRIVVLCEISAEAIARRGLDIERILAGYAELGFTLALFDDRGALYEMPAEVIVKLCRDRPEDATLVLRRPPA